MGFYFHMITSKYTESDYTRIGKRLGLRPIGERPTNSSSKAFWVCSSGHLVEIALQEVRRLGVCPQCHNGSRKQFSDYCSLANQLGIFWIGSSMPESSQTKTAWLCKKGHMFYSDYHSLRRGYSCQYCSKDLATPEDYVALGLLYGFAVDISYLPHKKSIPVMWICPKGHHFKQTFSYMYSIHSCFHCQVKPKTPNDYLRRGRAVNATWIGKRVPSSISHRTRWRCRKCDCVRHISYASLKGCAKCSGLLKKGISDYRTMGKIHNVRWVGDTLPGSTVHKTSWVCARGHTFYASYNRLYNSNRNGCRNCFIIDRRDPDGPTPKYGLDWTEKIRESIRSRDGNKCQICGIPANQVHHIVPARISDSVWKNTSRNLITLCHRHHFMSDWNLRKSIPRLRGILRLKFEYNYRGMMNYNIADSKIESWRSAM